MSYETNKKYAEAYYSRCHRVQIYFNPNKDQDLIEFLESYDPETATPTKIKTILRKYIAMQKAMSNI